ncbi:hypothetical protein B2J93_2433 [Marssonina coronariae]|uniref:Uncharacterized protein n=1 Tax=Diplocarpon coronariae TaxID=2795749 RepID=A0A218YYY3_9HELO|nr:hypothetical protein B2J93_2433 [Marssonina coronariae]
MPASRRRGTGVTSPLHIQVPAGVMQIRTWAEAQAAPRRVRTCVSCAVQLEPFTRATDGAESIPSSEDAVFPTLPPATLELGAISNVGSRPILARSCCVRAILESMPPAASGASVWKCASRWHPDVTLLALPPDGPCACGGGGAEAIGSSRRASVAVMEIAGLMSRASMEKVNRRRAQDFSEDLGGMQGLE